VRPVEKRFAERLKPDNLGGLCAIDPVHTEAPSADNAKLAGIS
jgi:hypothetical protein